jgi:hypothetical protein
MKKDKNTTTTTTTTTAKDTGKIKKLSEKDLKALKGGKSYIGDDKGPNMCASARCNEMSPSARCRGGK